MSNKYFICGHGKILKTRFIPNKNQTVVFFSMPGHNTYLSAGTRLLYDINKITENCIDGKKKTLFDINTKKCKRLNLIQCQKSKDCRPSPVPKQLNIKRTCLPNIDYQINPLKLLSTDRGIKKNCQNKYQCSFCDEINKEFNYDIRIWDSDRINLSGKGIPDLDMIYAPLLNSNPKSNDKLLFKYGIYQLPNRALDRFKKEFGNGLIDESMKKKLGFSPSDTINNNPSFYQKLINESFKGSINYNNRNQLIKGEKKKLSEILNELPEGIYFILSCRFSETKQYFNLIPDKPVFYNKENSFGITKKTNIVYFRDNKIIQLNSLIDLRNLPKIFFVKNLIINTSNIEKYRVGSFFGKDDNIKIIKINSDYGSKTGPGNLELKEYISLKDKYSDLPIAFIHIYNFIRESFNLIKLNDNHLEKTNIYILNSDDINFKESDRADFLHDIIIFKKFSILDFKPNFINHIINLPFKNILRKKTFIYRPTFFLCQGKINGRNQYLRVNINKMKRNNFFYAEILTNYNEVIKYNQKPIWKQFIGDKSYNILGIGDSKSTNNFIQYLMKQECCKYKNELFFLQDKEGIGDKELGLYTTFDEFAEDLRWILTDSSLGYNQSIIKNPYKLVNFIKKQMKNVSYIDYHQLINCNSMYNVSDNSWRTDELIDLKCYPFLYEDEISDEKNTKDISDYHLFDITKIPSLDLDNEFPHFRNGTRLAIFCNEENILLPIDDENTDKYLIREWSKLSRFREYADKAIIGTVVDYWFLKIDNTGEYLNIQNFLKLILDKDIKKNKLVTFVRLPFQDNISVGKYIWLAPISLNPETNLKILPKEYEQYLITETYLRGINDPPCIFYVLKLINVIDKKIVYFQPTINDKYNFLFGDEIQNVYSPEITLQREDSYKNLNKFT